MMTLEFSMSLKLVGLVLFGVLYTWQIRPVTWPLQLPSPIKHSKSFSKYLLYLLNVYIFCTRQWYKKSYCAKVTMCYCDWCLICFGFYVLSQSSLFGILLKSRSASILANSVSLVCSYSSWGKLIQQMCLYTPHLTMSPTVSFIWI